MFWSIVGEEPHLQNEFPFLFAVMLMGVTLPVLSGSRGDRGESGLRYREPGPPSATQRRRHGRGKHLFEVVSDLSGTFPSLLLHLIKKKKKKNTMTSLFPADGGRSPKPIFTALCHGAKLECRLTQRLAASAETRGWFSSHPCITSPRRIQMISLNGLGYWNYTSRFTGMKMILTLHWVLTGCCGWM